MPEYVPEAPLVQPAPSSVLLTDLIDFLLDGPNPPANRREAMRVLVNLRRNAPAQFAALAVAYDQARLTGQVA